LIVLSVSPTAPDRRHQARRAQLLKRNLRAHTSAQEQSCVIQFLWLFIAFISARTCQTLFQCQCCSSHRGRMPIRNWSLLLLVCCCCYTWHLASAHLPLVPKVTLRISIFFVPCSDRLAFHFSPVLICLTWPTGPSVHCLFGGIFFHLGVGSHLRNVIDSVLTSCRNGGFDQIHSFLPTRKKNLLRTTCKCWSALMGHLLIAFGEQVSCEKARYPLDHRCLFIQLRMK